MVPHIGFEPMISALRGRCPRPLDECGTDVRRRPPGRAAFYQSAANPGAGSALRRGAGVHFIGSAAQSAHLRHLFVLATIVRQDPRQMSIGEGTSSVIGPDDGRARDPFRPDSRATTIPRRK